MYTSNIYFVSLFNHYNHNTNTNNKYYYYKKNNNRNYKSDQRWNKYTRGQQNNS